MEEHTRTRKFLDDRINILDKSAVDASLGQEVFITVRAILVLTRVSVLVLFSRCIFSLAVNPGQDD